MPETWRIYIPGYGTFDFEGTQTEAKEAAANKARWEGVHNSMCYRKDRSTPLDKLTGEMADIWSEGRGVPIRMARKRGRMIAALKEAPDA